jgi:hypothetical protein
VYNEDGTKKYICHGYDEKNAALLAASPRLLASLEMIVDHAGGITGTITGGDWAMIHAVIAKAKGNPQP